MNCAYGVVRASPSLVRGMRPENARPRHQKVLAAIRAANAAVPVIATLLHEDADAVEPAHLTLITEKEGPLMSAPGQVIAVVPAWEIETWWLQFPDSVKALHPSWILPDAYVGRSVGMVRNSKEVLKRLVKQGLPRTSRAPDYSENDSPLIAQQIVLSGQIHSPRASSDSWQHFVQRIMAL